MQNAKKNCVVYFLACLFLIILSSTQILADTYVGGIINTDTTWTKANSPYIVTSNLMIIKNVTLIIEPGVIIKFNNATGLKNNGRLIAIGTKEDLIIFTSNRETPNYDDWRGIQFDSDAIGSTLDEEGNYSDGSILYFCRVEYAESIQNIHANISINISNCFIEGGGIYSTGEKSIISNNIINGHAGASGNESIISNNIINGCIASQGNDISISENQITKCEGSGIHISGKNVQIRNNIISHSGAGIGVEARNVYILNNVIANNGAWGINCTWSWAGAKDITIQYNLIRDNGYSGIDNASDDVVISNNVISGNADNGIRQLGWNLTFTQNNICNNHNFDFYNHSEKNIYASENYWGTNDTFLIGNKIYDFYDDFERGIVSYQPIASEPFKEVDFVASPLSGQYPLQVSFDNKSIGIITSSMWDFGDGITSTEQNPSHSYNSEGNYTVSLTMTSETGTQTESKINYISVSKPQSGDYTLNLSKTGNGSVMVNGIPFTLPWSGQFPSGTNVHIEAVPDSGWSFSNWTGDYGATANPTTITMNGNKIVTVNFSQTCDYSLTIIITPSGSGSAIKNPDKANYCHGEQVMLTANPAAGYNFSSWGGVDSGNGLTASVTMNNNRTVEANFSLQAENEPEINVSPAILDFGNIKTGQISAPQNIAISNSGSGDLVLGTLSITGEGAWVFSMQNDNCSGKTLTQTESCTVDIVFSPVAAGSFDANLSIPSNDVDEPLATVDLKGKSGPDLTGNWLFLNHNCKNTKKGIKCNIKSKINIRNIGANDAASSEVRFYLSDNETFGTEDIFLKRVSTGKLKAGKGKNKAFSYNFKLGDSAADKYVIAVLDADGKLAEADKLNNYVFFGPLP